MVFIDCSNGYRSAVTPVDAYLANLPHDQRDALQSLRVQLHELLPGAQEVMSYRLPTLRYRERMIVSFGASGARCAIYLLSSTVLEPFRARLGDFQTGKGSVRFPPERPVPPDLLRALVSAKLAETCVQSAGEGASA